MKTIPALSISSMLVIVVMAGLAGCSAPPPDSGPAGLKALLEEIHQAIASKNYGKAAKITQGLFPDKSRLAAAFNDGIEADDVQRVIDFHAQLLAETDDLARVFEPKPGQNVIEVHSATTEDIALYSLDSVAYAKFPGGAHDLAQQGFLRPGVTFYEVEFLEPGATLGTTYHLFYWDGKSWAMLGPVWRVLTKAAEN